MPRTELHDKYDAAVNALQDAATAIVELRNAAPGEAFSWECDNALPKIALSLRYMSKPGEVLYCNWTGCPYADKAILYGEGAPWYKGRVHESCSAALDLTDSI